MLLRILWWRDHSHSGLSGWVLNAISSVFIRESRGTLHTHTHTHTHRGEIPYEARCVDRSDVAIVKNCPVTRCWKEGRIGFSLRMSRGTAVLTTLCCCYLLAQLCPTLWDPMNYSPPGSSVHDASQARTLYWVVISFSRGSSQPRDQTHGSCIGRLILYHWVTRETLPISWFQPKFQTSGL